MNRFKKAVLGLICTIVLIGMVGFGYVYSKLNSIYVKDEVVKSEQEEVQGTMVEGVTNILLVGTDGNNVDRGN